MRMVRMVFNNLLVIACLLVGGAMYYLDLPPDLVRLYAAWGWILAGMCLLVSDWAVQALRSRETQDQAPDNDPNDTSD
jgi:hypothetical protein